MTWRGIALVTGLMLLLSACGHTVRTQHPDDLTFAPLTFAPPKVEHFTLANGIRVYLREDRELPLVAVTAMLEAGAVSDPPGKNGLARLHGAALRGGGTATRTPRQVEEQLAQLAADLEATGESYATQVGLSLQSGDLATGLDILAEFLRNPRFAPERVELARQGMLEAIRREEDHPAAVAAKVLAADLYHGHVLGRRPNAKTVAAVTRSDLVAFHARFFRPDNLWLAVSGDIDRADLQALLERFFGDWTVLSAPLVQDVAPLPEPRAPALRVAAKELPQTTVLFGQRGIDKNDPELHALQVLNFILGGGGFNSRLMREIRSNRGLAYSVYSHFQIGRRLPGLFLAGAETKNTSVDEVVGLMRAQMAALRETPVTAEELALAKNSLINSFVFAFEDSHEIVTRAMRLDFYDYPADYLQRYRERLAAVTAADVQAAARRHLRLDEQTVVLVGAPSHPEDTAARLGLVLKDVEEQASSTP
jgi:zinc protease